MLKKERCKPRCWLVDSEGVSCPAFSLTSLSKLSYWLFFIFLVSLLLFSSPLV